MPKNWGKPGRTVPGFDPDSAAFDLRDTDEFTDNINVIASPTGRISPDEIEDGVQEELERTGATDVEVHDRVVIAGEESAHVSGGSSVNDVDYIVEQYYVSNDDQTFVVTFSFSPDVPAKKRTRVTDSTLSTWTWNA
ncbi:hypothetical protein C7S10_11400 [Nocardioides currus]|uniref:DUF1795 domain-containing protein n=1 Tax=Nocardioides currus TaxID=2133958 RepID=A0A2R7YX76_9ACTN|nr:hypothetical protein C7S10_11400 [Nocardioides currus]